jgi:hypothetical protein
MLKLEVRNGGFEVEARGVVTSDPIFWTPTSVGVDLIKKYGLRPLIRH